ncbi:MAG TPA: hypothetical protein VN653_15920 [Anaerolineales bacterium]|nr:hypothetical protein [Anaerolineales bacterium]
MKPHKSWLMPLFTEIHSDNKYKPSDELFGLMRPYLRKYHRDPENEEDVLILIFRQMRKDVTEQGKISLNSYLSGQTSFNFAHLADAIVTVGKKGWTIRIGGLGPDDVLAIDETDVSNRDEVAVAYSINHAARLNLIDAFNQYSAKTLDELAAKGWKPSAN